MISVRLIISTLLVAALFSLAGCSSQRRIKKGKPLRPKSASAISNKLEKTLIQYDWLGMKVEIDINAKGKKNGFKATVRVRKDSMIWMSITPLLGMEAAKVVITPDSIKYISKIPGDRHYFLGDIASLREKFSIPFDFYMMQDLFVGNPIAIGEKDHFKSQVDDQQYVLISQFTRKLKKATGVDEKKVSPEDSVTVRLEGKKMDRIIRKADGDDLVFKRYWVSGESYKLERTRIEDLLNKRTIEITHGDFGSCDGQWIPETTRLKVSDQEGVSEIEIEIKRLKMNKAYEMPFEIPEDYERRYY